MYSDTVQRTQGTTESGIRSKSSCYRRKDCHRSMFIRNLGTTLRRSRVSIRVVTGIVFVLLAGPVFIHLADAQGTAGQDAQQLPPGASGPSTNAPPPHPVAPPEPGTQTGKTPAAGQQAGT